jgi:pimeloyl-ACP methyl ester carboxylesterase
MKEKWFTRKRWWFWLPLLFILLLLVATGGFVAWASSAAQPQAEARQALQSDAQVQVTTDPWYIFQPVNEQPTTGFIFYPGGRVDARAYAPEARAIAAEGYLVVIVPMPLNLAVIAPDRAARVIEAYPDVARWVVGGHSLGGSMAASFAHDYPNLVEGLVLWASYPANWHDLSARTDLRVASIYGTLDGLTMVEQIEDSAALLPSDTVFVPVAGGNHAQFGWYGPQAGDLEATISHEAQSAQVVAATLALLEAAANN